jgi:hypothetical protein
LPAVPQNFDVPKPKIATKIRFGNTIVVRAAKPKIATKIRFGNTIVVRAA